MFFFTISFIFPLALAFTDDCYYYEPPQCDDGILCHMGYDDNGCDMGSYCAYGYGDCPATCSAYCGPNDAYCSYGYDYETGCNLGEYCAPGYDMGDFVCPGVCPVTCGEGETWCENPLDANGCSTGNSCMPEGMECPVTCPDVPYAECDWETEFNCWGGEDANGCQMADYCVPHYSGAMGTDGQPCWSYCDASASCLSEGAVLCDNGYDYNGCWMGNSCNKPWDHCPAVCYEYCSGDMQWCDYGYDDMGCHLGNYCAPECMDMTTM